MTQKDNVSMSPLVRFWGVLVFCFLFLVAGILCLGLFPAEPHFSKKQMHRQMSTLQKYL